jgi:hypothetical protein
MSDDPVILTGAGILITGGIIAAYPVVLCYIAALALLIWTIRATDQAHTRRKAISHRADTQHRMYLAGDPRGVYGDYPPAETA